MLLWYSEETTHPPYVTLRNKKILELLPNTVPAIYVEQKMVGYGVHPTF